MSEEAAAVVQSGDKRYFAWAKKTGIWLESGVTPQIIHDKKMYDWIMASPNALKSTEILAYRELEPEEYGLTINQLATKYPYKRSA